MRYAIAFLLTLMLVACNTAVPGDEGTMRYARWLMMTDSTATVLNPWRPGEVLHEYALEPCSRAVSATSLHAYLAHRLGATDRLVGVMDADYIVAPDLRAALSPDADMGSSQSPNLERIKAAGADLIFASPFENAGYGALETLGVPIVECADYMEATPLGRAEWMRFYGRLLGRAAEADSLFAAEEAAYKALCTLSSAEASASKASVPADASAPPSPASKATVPEASAEGSSPSKATVLADASASSSPASKATVPEASAEGSSPAEGRPTVLLGKRSGQAWYVPSGRSYLGTLLDDAGAAYVFADEDATGSLPFDFETVYSRTKDADLWLITYTAPPRADGTFAPMTYADLAAEDERYTHFRAFREHHVWACNTLEVPYYDVLPWAPATLLREVTAIVHPDRLPDYTPHYFKPLR